MPLPASAFSSRAAARSNNNHRRFILRLYELLITVRRPSFDIATSYFIALLIRCHVFPRIVESDSSEETLRRSRRPRSFHLSKVPRSPPFPFRVDLCVRMGNRVKQRGRFWRKYRRRWCGEGREARSKRRGNGDGLRRWDFVAEINESWWEMRDVNYR